CLFVFSIDPPTSAFSTLSLHDALPISHASVSPDYRASRSAGSVAPQVLPDHDRRLGSPAEGPDAQGGRGRRGRRGWRHDHLRLRDRKSTRLNSSHSQISYAVFCLKKKK